MDEIDDVARARRQHRAANAALAVLLVGACGWLVFDLLPALSLVAQMLRG